MFFRKTERKKHHPVLIASVTALTVIGACTVVGMSKQKMKQMCESIKTFCTKKKDCACDVASEIVT